MNRNTATKAGVFAGLALLALLAVPNTSAAQLNRVDLASLCAADEHVNTSIGADIALAPDVEIDAIAINTEAVCRFAPPGTPPGVCSYYEDADERSIDCTVSKDGTGVCYGYSYHYNKTTGETTYSCYKRVGL